MKSNLISRRPNSNRFPGSAYTLPGAYYVTIVTYKHIHLFGEITQSEMKLNPCGKNASEQWMRLSVCFSFSDFSTFVVMPNHVHGVILLQGAGEDLQYGLDQNSPLRPYSRSSVVPGSLGAIVRAYKSAVSYRIKLLDNNKTSSNLATELL